MLGEAMMRGYAMGTTLGIVKPEGIARSLVEPILERIRDAGLTVTDTKRMILTSEQFELIYGKVEEPDWLHQKRREYLTSNDVLLVKITGDDAVRRLLELRGSSHEQYARPGTIRGDFAPDQDYAVLRRRREIALNVFHACDTAAEAEYLIMMLGL